MNDIRSKLNYKNEDELEESKKRQLELEKKREEELLRQYINDCNRFIPINIFSEQLGATINVYEEDDYHYPIVEILLTDDITIYLEVGINEIQINEGMYTLEIARKAPFMEKNTIFFPAEILKHKLGLSVKWNDDTNEVIVNANKMNINEAFAAKLISNTLRIENMDELVFGETVIANHEYGKLIGTKIYNFYRKPDGPNSDNRSSKTYIGDLKTGNVYVKRLRKLYKQLPVNITLDESIIDESIKKHYITDFPEITSVGHHWVGNWRGTVSDENGNKLSDEMIFIMSSGPIKRKSILQDGTIRWQEYKIPADAIYYISLIGHDTIENKNERIKVEYDYSSDSLLILSIDGKDFTGLVFKRF